MSVSFPLTEHYILLIGFIVVLIIPIHIVWQIQINLRQKLILGTTLGLSIFMIIIAIVRISRFQGELAGLDVSWIIFWQQVEASIAIIMVSVSAFRSFCVARESQRRENRNRNRQWYMNPKNLMASALRRKRLRSESEETNHSVAIPRATITGMRTFINRRGRSISESRLSSSLGDENAKRIRAEQSISFELDQVRQGSA